jgi:hypothetical protein
MAGYFLYSLDGNVFSQLTTSPTRPQALALADAVLDELQGMIDDFLKPEETSIWSTSREALAEVIQTRLGLSDWYSDLVHGDAVIWEYIIGSLDDKAGKKIGIRYKCENDGYLYWDAPRMAAERGATLMAAAQFGHSGFRYFGVPSNKYSSFPMYSMWTADQTRELLSQLEAVTPYFSTLPDGEGSDRDQFFKGLLEPVQRVVRQNRILWVQTDT